MLIVKCEDAYDVARCLVDYHEKAVIFFVDWTSNTVYISFGKETDYVQDALVYEAQSGGK